MHGRFLSIWLPGFTAAVLLSGCARPAPPSEEAPAEDVYVTIAPDDAYSEPGDAPSPDETSGEAPCVNIAPDDAYGGTPGSGDPYVTVAPDGAYKQPTVQAAPTIPRNARPRIRLTDADISMAQSVIAENTMTIPGMAPGSTIKTGPGDFDDADRLVLMGLKLHHELGALVPYSGFVDGLSQSSAPRFSREAASRFWAWYREVAPHGPSPELGGMRGEFGTYINMKMTHRLEKQNQQLEAVVASDEAWRRAMESDRAFRAGIAAGEEQARQARAKYMNQWGDDAQAAALAEIEWQIYIAAGAGHMDEPKG